MISMLEEVLIQEDGICQGYLGYHHPSDACFASTFANLFGIPRDCLSTADDAVQGGEEPVFLRQI
jgi:hypothetical protein